jgi:hypothetical protein
MSMLALSAQPPSKFAATHVSEVIAHRSIHSRCLKTWMFRLVARPAFQISLSTKFTFPGLTDGAIQIKQGVRRLLTRMEGSMRRLTDEEVSRVQDVCRLLPLWKRSEFLQELARRMQAPGPATPTCAGRRRRQCVRCSVAATPGCRSRTERCGAFKRDSGVSSNCAVPTSGDSVCSTARNSRWALTLYRHQAEASSSLARMRERRQGRAGERPHAKLTVATRRNRRASS